LPHDRTDYAVEVAGGWCIVEVKQIEPNDADDELMRELMQGKSVGRWVEPGKRLRPKVRRADPQRGAFSRRGFPTVACIYDNTASFHSVDLHVMTAMFGREVLRFDVSGAKNIKDSFLGTRRRGAAVCCKAYQRPTTPQGSFPFWRQGSPSACSVVRFA
jgi:hypothetical protein